MSEHKKVSLTSLGPKKVQKKEEKKTVKSVRLTLTLAEPSKTGCPIFDYEALINGKKQNDLGPTKKEGLNGTTPFPDDDDAEVARMAKHFEDKYSDRRYTYAELGAGYDESDSFIDNTDICEEELTNEEFKKFQGFYINKEKFESGSDTEKKTKRRRRSTQQSESDSTSESRSKKKFKKSKKKLKKQSSVPNGNKIISDSSLSGSSSSSSDSESEKSVKV